MLKKIKGVVLSWPMFVAVQVVILFTALFAPYPFSFWITLTGLALQAMAMVWVIRGMFNRRRVP